MNAERVEFTDIRDEDRALYLALREVLREPLGLEEGVFPDGPAEFGESFARAGATAEAHVAFVSVYGLVLADGYGGESADDPRLEQTALGALAGFRAHREVFEKVLNDRIAEGTGVSARQVAEVARQLVERGVGSISPDRLRAVSVIYYASRLEEAGLFRVMDRVAEQFMAGMLPISKGAGGARIDRWLKDADQRLTETERTEAYARAFGATSDSEFHDLWGRLLAAMTGLIAAEEDKGEPTADPEEVRRTARELAVLLSSHGRGVDLDAERLGRLVDEAIAALSDPEILGAYGAKDLWQLVERVSEKHLGETPETSRHRTMATAGAKILGFLADHADRLSSPETFRMAEIREPCEQWIVAS